jgi:Tol biopolymer transport system component
MGEVYKATDTRLRRTVAIKILPEHVAGMEDVKARFDREAQTIASLNHPNICTLHDVGHEDGLDFLVLEYLEGETLAARIARGALPLPEALSAGLAIADALDRAHRQSVIHRDLKPANVILTKTGPKVLDFGLAKWTMSSEKLLAAMPTRADVTAKGTMLGTLQYMAPEQIEGREADARTDVFAFGALLYEMITAKTPFEGRSQATLISAIMSRDPKPLTLLAPMSPPALEHLIERCLAKDPDDRWQSMHSVLVQLRWIAFGGAQPTAPAVESPAARWRRRVLVAMAATGALAAALLAAPAYLQLRGPGPGEPFSYRVPVRAFQAVAIAPDGSGFVFSSTPDAITSAPALYYRATGALSSVALGGTTNAGQPFFSPDGRDIAFVSSGALRRMPVAGGPVRTLGSVGEIRGGTWSRNGVILFGSAKGLFRIPDQGGTPEPVTTVEGPSTGHFWPTFLPDGVNYLFISWSSEQNQRVLMAGMLGSKDQAKLAALESRVRYTGSGHLVYQQAGALFARPFDVTSRSVRGEPTQLVEMVGFRDEGGAFDVSDTGALIYYAPGPGGRGRGRGNENPQGQFSWVTRGGAYVQPLGEPGPWGDIDLSPDGNLVAMTRVDDGTGDIWVLDWQRGPTGTATRLTLDPADDRNPVWSPDGKQVAFTTFRKGNADIYVKNANNVGAEEPLLATDRFEAIEDWARDGSHIAYLTNDTQPDIWAMPLTGDRKPFEVVRGAFDKNEPQFSRDAKWLAYGSNESGAWEVYVISFPDRQQREKVSVGGGFQPRWSRDGNTLYYRALGGRVLAAAIIKTPTPRVATPVQLFTANFQGGYANAPQRHQWSLSPDDTRFLLRAPHQASVAGAGLIAAPFTLSSGAAAGAGGPIPNPPPGGLTMLLNWPAAIRKAPQ